MTWKQHIGDSWFREEDHAYAGKDHTKNNKTFICISGVDMEDIHTGFKTLQSAMDYIDNNYDGSGND